MTRYGETEVIHFQHRSIELTRRRRRHYSPGRGSRWVDYWVDHRGTVYADTMVENHRNKKL